MKSLGSVDARGLSVRLELCDEGGTLLERFSTLMLLVTTTDITVWIVSALLALGIGAGKYAKWKSRNQLVRQLAAMDRERREKVLSRMNPTQAMEARQELMRRFNIF
jgi:negative regulator of sigma E activity